MQNILVRKAVIPAAGIGSRLLPITKVVPKELLPVLSRPSIHFVAEEAVAAGIERTALVISPGKESLVRYFRSDIALEKWLKRGGKQDLIRELRALSDRMKVTKVVQKKPLGLGHAVLCAEHFVGREPFAVVLPDDLFVGAEPCLKQMIRMWNQLQAPIVALMKVPRRETVAYGIVKAVHVSKSIVRIEGMIEKPRPADAPSNLGIVGRYILPPSIFGSLKRTRPGWGGEIQLTDGLKDLLRKGPVYGYVFSGRRLDMGSRAGLVETMAYFASKERGLAKALARGARGA